MTFVRIVLANREYYSGGYLTGTILFDSEQEYQISSVRVTLLIRDRTRIANYSYGLPRP